MMGGYTLKQEKECMDFRKQDSQKKMLKEKLVKHIYVKIKLTPAFWKHKWQQICFILLFGAFRVKHQVKEQVGHLISAIKENHEIVEDW